MSNITVYLHLSTQTAPKTSLNAQGGIVYALLKDEASTEIFFTFLENQGGSGYFGREIIPFANITACLTGADLKQTIPAKRFLKAFSVSRSVNNGGFLCACPCPMPRRRLGSLGSQEGGNSRLAINGPEAFA
ncbi:hypothetical protein [Quatrionicoccus australiensis]|uniref:hypothetical protein n=1 Tax=Quatrionicoccus australiensis TaxID=138118 RepID=UPI001CFB0E83|nr:hypothetical protein [Quatrionicoccus australiensis]MCB4360707.1 hypothetical protein [Quatrionicoccus australiensis]